MRQPQIALLGDGRRLHLQDGPIDLVIEAFGAEDAVAAAYAAATQRFTGLLDELVAELPLLRCRARGDGTALTGVVARRMYAAVAPFADECFVTPMAAVSGAVAVEILQAMEREAPLASPPAAGAAAVSRSASLTRSPYSRRRPRRLMPPRPSSPMRSICPAIRRSNALPPPRLRLTMISATSSSRGRSARSCGRRSAKRSSAGLRVHARCTIAA